MELVVVEVVLAVHFALHLDKVALHNCGDLLVIAAVIGLHNDKVADAVNPRVGQLKTFSWLKTHHVLSLAKLLVEVLHEGSRT